MNTAELIRNDNIYRATGGWCWMATFEVVKTESAIRYIKPMVRKVEIDSPSGSVAGVKVRPVTGDPRLISAHVDSLFDDREHAAEFAATICDGLDGQSVMGAITYKYVRPKVRAPKAPPIEVRVRQVGASTYVVDRRLEGRWKEVRGLGYLTKWKATDTAKRIRCGLDVPGYWTMPGGEEFVELCDYEV
jgi:hypothetical protein